MKIFGWFILFLLGYSLVCLLCGRLKSVEKLVFSLPVGLGMNSVIMALIDLIGSKINNLSLLFLVDFIVLTFLIIVATLLKKIDTFKIIIPEDFTVFPINLGWILIVALAVHIIINVCDFAMLWPVHAYDSVAGYDFLARAIVHEGNLKNSIFDPNNSLATIRSFYPPLAPHNYAYAYLLGYQNSKIVQALLLLSLYLSFYLLLKRYTSHLGAAIWTFLMVITPQLIKYFALSSTNAVCAYYAPLGMICVFIWFEKTDESFFFLGVILSGIALWSRTEALVFTVASGFIVLIKCIKDRDWVKVFIFGGLCALMFLSWQYFVRVGLADVYIDPGIGKAQSSPGKFGRMMALVSEVIFSSGKYWGQPKGNNYGLIPQLFLIAIVANAYFIYKKKDKVFLLLMIFVAFVFYMGVLYIIDTDYQSEKMSGYIYAGFRRGFISFIPVLIFYVAVNNLSLRLFNKYLKIE